MELYKGCVFTTIVANENTHIKDTHSKFVIHYEISSVGRAQAF